MKRILTLDGGGIRGVFTLTVLQRIEELFRVEKGNPQLVLRDEFEFFAGTSTGGIIATFLALGKSVAEILDLYETRGGEMFSKARIIPSLLRNRYEARAIEQFFRTELQEADGTAAKLGTSRFMTEGKRATYVLIVMRNASTGSPWVVTNNPRSKYNQRSHPECNLDVELWRLLRASTAAPTFFSPEQITFPSGRCWTFVDGGLTPYNNPSLLAAITATMPNHAMNWETGVGNLQVVSVGTGSDPAHLPAKKVAKLHKLDFARYIAPALIESVASEQDLICRVIGNCLHGENVDRETGQLLGPTIGLLGAREKLFSYVRYNTRLNPEHEGIPDARAPSPFELDNLKRVPELKEKGASYAAVAVKREHFFPPFQADQPTRLTSRFSHEQSH